MILGIGTQSNNGLGNATVYTTDDRGNFTTTFAGHSYPASFIDSGSNGFFFLTSGVTGLEIAPIVAAGFYCPPSTQSLTVQNTGTNGASNPVTFDVGNAEQLLANNNAVFPDVGGPMSGGFDFGLPFFFGRESSWRLRGRRPPPAEDRTGPTERKLPSCCGLVDERVVGVVEPHVRGSSSVQKLPN